MHVANRRRFLAFATGATAAASLSAPAIARERRIWRLATSWPRNAPGPGTTAARLAERITALSSGRLTVELHAAGELVPALEVFDAVSAGTVEMGHSAALFWSGKMPSAPYFTAVPFGLMPEGHDAWLTAGGGQALWDELYGTFGVKPFAAGNSGIQMGGWYRRRIEKLEDMKGLRLRMPGLGGEVLRRLGAAPVTLPPGEIFGALSTGAIDGAEFLGPWQDRALGLQRAATFYLWPGWHEPNGSAEALISAKAYADLPSDLQQLVTACCEVENRRGPAEAEWRNAAALAQFEEEGTVTLHPWPTEVLRAARLESEAVLAELAETSALDRRIRDSYSAAKTLFLHWGRVGRHALLSAQIDA
ncbi:TRAP transporter substrate-binding protein [Algihabitans albus]|uniref:TRAP transporter substrate-binding protein n=1 Tax=Algihabitans albus TaxID=2164067 RepID=UPI000E5D9BE1|nr:TRAP transporter substrate-binding protein [Algihabitans albus]